MVEVIESQQEAPATLRLAFLYSAYEPQFGIWIDWNQQKVDDDSSTFNS